MAHPSKPLNCKPSPKGTGEYIHCTMKDKGFFDPRSFRTVSPNDDVRITIGCPRGKWDDRERLCRASTQAQRIMYHEDTCSEFAACRIGQRLAKGKITTAEASRQLGKARR